MDPRGTAWSGGIPREYHQQQQASILAGQLAALQQRYQEWRNRQVQALNDREMQLEERKMQIEQEVMAVAGAAAGQIAAAQLQVEAYAQAVAQAITRTENPYEYRGSGQPGPLTAAPPAAGVPNG